MPNRILKESTCTSDTIASLSDFEYRVWTVLILLADDAGRGDARPAVIKGRGFPLRERVTSKDIDAAIHGLVGKGCISLYNVGGKSYYYFPTWSDHQRVRNVKPKYPPPNENDSFCGELPQSAADCGELRPTCAGAESESESESESNPNPNTESNSENARSAQSDGPDLSVFGPELQKAMAEWLAYKKEKGNRYKPIGLKQLITETKNNAEKYGEKAVVDLIKKCESRNYQGIIFSMLEEDRGKPGTRSNRTIPTTYNIDPNDQEAWND